MDVHVDYIVVPEVYHNQMMFFVVHVDYKEHRLLTTDLGDDDVVHVDYEEHLLITIVLRPRELVKLE